MGTWVNPEGEQFRLAVKNPLFVDKSGLLSFTNGKIGDPFGNCICVSRPRRFGKTMAVAMLAAYYSKNGDSRDLFCSLEIAKDPSFEKHCNKHNVISLDIQAMAGEALEVAPSEDPLIYISKLVIDELKELHLGCIPEGIVSLRQALRQITKQTHEKFIFLLDEWDVIYREEEYAGMQNRYTRWLKGLSKGSDTAACIDLVYLTGIFPIPQQKTQSAMNNFDEYTMQDPYELAPYVGFTDDEVQALCSKYEMPYEAIRDWYDGYEFDRATHIYCPCSVVRALTKRKIANYWNETASNKEILEAYQSDLPGLREAIAILLSQQSVEINPGSFKRDAGSPETCDEVLASMVHLGYLVYEESSQTVRIANKEVADEFMKKLRRLPNHYIWKIISQSKALLEKTLAGNAEAVAEGIEFAHNYYTNPLTYNNEAALGSVVALAYHDAFAGDYTLLWELPTGKGFADIVLLPVKASRTNKPILIELKWDKPADTALQQISNRSYTGRLIHYPEILLVGISYVSDPDKPDYKKHTCVIQTWKWQNP